MGMYRATLPDRKKTGKWEETDKAETKIEGTFEEWGNCPNAKRKTCGYGRIVWDDKGRIYECGDPCNE